MSTKIVITCETCGHTTPPGSRAKAEYGIRKHSCATVIERAARAQRRLDRLALSGPEAPCQHTPGHPHGTYVRYVIDLCRCRPCRDANAAYVRDLTRRHLYGKPSYVDAGPARAHIKSLQAAGMGWRRIARTAGVAQSTVGKILYGCPTRGMGRSKRIRAATEAAILAVTLDLGATIGVPGTGTRRRVQALVATGWSQSKIAHHLGMTSGNFGKVIHGTSNVHAATRRAVADLYDELWDQAPPQAEWRDKIAHSRSVRYAAAAGWAVPLAWDEDTIDDPNTTPDLGEPATRTWRKFTLEDLDFILDNDPLTLDQAARRFGVNRSAIEHACTRNNRGDLLTRMARNKTVQENAA